jgi:hypothetical protein
LRAVVTVAAAVVIVGAAAGIWFMLYDSGPVAAADARIEMTFSGDGTSYSGDRKIVEGTARFTLFNESTERLALLAHRYDPGSTDLAADPGEVQEGIRFLPGAHEVPESAIELLEFEISPGSRTWTLDLRPGIYLFDVGYGNYQATGVWRAAVIEVVSH